MKAQSFFIIALVILMGCNSPSDYKFNQREVVFYNKYDHVPLSGLLTLPAGSIDVPAVVLLHGSGPMNRDLEFFGRKLFKDLAEYLSNRGIAVLRYDKRGVGNSGGIFKYSDWENLKNDGISAVEYLRTLAGIDKNKIGVIGISEGGLVGPMMASSSPDINFVVMLAGPGIWGKEFFYSSQLAITKAAGFNENDIKEMTAVFNEYWTYAVKESLSNEEIRRGKDLLKKLWSYIDAETRNEWGYVDSNIDFWFNLYRDDIVRNSYSYIPRNTISQIKCPVLAVNGDKDLQVDSKINLGAIKNALEKGMCENFKVIELKDHNHVFQKCKTGKLSEYNDIKGTMSEESMSIVEKWIKATVKK